MVGFFKENGGLVNSTGGKFNLVRKLNKDKLTFEDVARKNQGEFKCGSCKEFVVSIVRNLLCLL